MDRQITMPTARLEIIPKWMQTWNHLKSMKDNHFQVCQTGRQLLLTHFLQMNNYQELGRWQVQRMFSPHRALQRKLKQRACQGSHDTYTEQGSTPQRNPKKTLQMECKMVQSEGTTVHPPTAAQATAVQWVRSKNFDILEGHQTQVPYGNWTFKLDNPRILLLLKECHLPMHMCQKTKHFSGFILMMQKLQCWRSQM